MLCSSLVQLTAEAVEDSAGSLDLSTEVLVDIYCLSKYAGGCLRVKRTSFIIMSHKSGSHLTHAIRLSQKEY